MKEYQDSEVLRKFYWEEELSFGKIAEKFGVSKSLIQFYMEKYGIERRALKFVEIKPVESSEDLAYWVGVAQSDGCLYRYLDRGTVQFRIAFGVHLKSLPMLEKFRRISKIIFDRDGKIRKTKKAEWVYHIGVKSLLPIFDKLDIKFGKFVPPAWVLEKPVFFGAYLAGIIDGDGTVGIKRPKYPQCLISITSGSIQIGLEKAIKDVMKCSVFQMEHYQKRFIKTLGRIVEGKWWHLEFCVSSKTAEFILDYVSPHLQLEYKKKKLEDFILRRYPSVIEN